MNDADQTVWKDHGLSATDHHPDSVRRRYVHRSRMDLGMMSFVVIVGALCVIGLIATMIVCKP